MDDQKNKTSEVVHKFAPVSPVINCSFRGERYALVVERGRERERESRGGTKNTTLLDLYFSSAVLFNCFIQHIKS